jgi:hypothetical protein
MGTAIKITDTMQAYARWCGGESCAAVATSVPTPSPCHAKINSAAAASISASLEAKHCRVTAVPPNRNCPEDEVEAAAQQTAVGMVGLCCLPLAR